MPSQPATASQPPQRVAKVSGGDGGDFEERLTRLEVRVDTLATREYVQEQLAASEKRLGEKIYQIKTSVDGSIAGVRKDVEELRRRVWRN